jgi:lysozyme family protein
MANFEAALGFVFAREGGYSDNPLDHGGATNFGVTLSALKSFRSNPNLTYIDVQALTKLEASKVYRANYWDKLHLDEVADDTLATVLFDQAVNRGTDCVALQVQHLLGLDADGVVGKKTIQALNKVSAPKFTADFILKSQEIYVKIAQKNMSQLTFLGGWIHRTHELLKLLLERAA